MIVHLLSVDNVPFVPTLMRDSIPGTGVSGSRASRSSMSTMMHGDAGPGASSEESKGGSTTGVARRRTHRQSTGGRFPSVWVTAECITKKGERRGEPVRWPQVEVRDGAVFHKPRKLADKHRVGDFLMLTVHGRSARHASEDVVLGWATVPVTLAEDPAQSNTNSGNLHTCTVEVELSDDVATVPEADSCSITLAFLPAPADHKTVFVVRHAESRWNDAKKHLKLFDMVGGADHSLTPQGCHQAEALRLKLAALQAKEPSARSLNEQRLIAADMFLCSPMTRALQTAFIGFSSHEAFQKRGLRLLADVREHKKTFASFDCVGVAVGTQQIAERLVSETVSSYTEMVDVTTPEAFSANFGLSQPPTDFIHCVDTMHNWWSASGFAEDSASFDQRMTETINYLRYMPESTIVLVGHSLFIRDMMRRYTNPSSAASLLQGAPGCTLGEASEYKLANCGLMAFDMDFACAQPVVGAELMLDSALCGFTPEGPPQEDFEFFVCASQHTELSAAAVAPAPLETDSPPQPLNMTPEELKEAAPY